MLTPSAPRSTANPRQCALKLTQSTCLSNDEVYTTVPTVADASFSVVAPVAGQPVQIAGESLAWSAPGASCTMQAKANLTADFFNFGWLNYT